MSPNKRSHPRPVGLLAGAILSICITSSVNASTDEAWIAEIQTRADTTPRFIELYAGEAVAPGVEIGVAARNLARENRSRLGLDARSDFAVLRSITDQAGRRHVRLNQSVGGVPVFGGEVVVHFMASGVGESITGRPIPLNRLSTTTPSITKAAAARTAVKSVGSGTASSIELLVADTDTLFRSGNGLRLAYKVVVSGPGVRSFVFVDAMHGAELGTLSGIHSVKNRNTYDMNNSTNYGAATLERAEGDPASGDVDVDNAHDFAGDTYDFFSLGYGRDSIDDAGFTMRSYTHYGVNYLNAFWDGTRMTYGDGFPIDDIVGHEITHGLTEHTADLIYSYQSGALNESFSDIFGEVIDQLNGAGSDTAADKWLVGEDLPVFGAIRDMADPATFGDPDRVGSPNYYCGAGDFGGVHINSGVPNKNFYLLVEGGTFNGVSVSAIGLIKASALHYHSLTNYLTPTSDMQDHLVSLWRSCRDLQGVDLNDPVTGAPSGEILSRQDCSQIRRAGMATELRDPVCP